MANESEARLKTFAMIIKFGHDLFDGKDLKSTAAAAVNNSYQLLKFRSAALFRLDSARNCRVLGQFGQSDVNEFSAAVQQQKKLIAEARFDQNGAAVIENRELPEELAENNALYLLCRLTPPAAACFDGTYVWLLEYEKSIPENILPTVRLLGKSIAEALCLAESSSGPGRRLPRFFTGIGRWILLLLLLAAVMLLPVRETSTAEFMLKAPEVTAAYTRIDGTVTGVMKKDGTPVKKGETVLQLDRSELEYRLADARARLKEAEADLELAQQNAFTDESKLGNVKLLRARCRILQVAVDEAQWLLKHTVIKAPADGILVLDEERSGEITGRAVKAGDKLFEIYGGRGMTAEVMVHERDSSILHSKFDSELFLHTAPEKGLTGRIISVAHYPTLNERNQYCYQIRMELPESEKGSLRFGMRGVAKLSGGNVCLGYWLFKSIILYFRSW